ncbi:MAG: DUF86 domain-containing protein [Bacteroidales bacterium]|nr:DUF86 domain-containing protein [Bacteroidales bacterium]MBD5219866.1 DUF86 domain-containing protein [Bacteroidales bacterium]MDE6436703.1 DUF86 domain-containing protein [Muribaculaceae bacterium]
MERSVKKSLEDILQMIDEIDSFFEPGQKRFDFYMSNTCLRRAIQMNLAIIGEATNRILKIDPDTAISSARKIVSTRNFLIHGYDSLSHDIIWGIVIRYLPLLRQEVHTLLNYEAD